MNSDKKQSILGLIPLFEVMGEYGIDPELILSNHYLDLSSLSGTALIPCELEFKIIADALSLIDDPLFGLKVGSQSSFTSYGTFALLVMTAPTFREACQTSVQFQDLSLLFTRMSMHVEHDFYELRYSMPPTLPSILPFIADRDFAGTFNFINEVIDEQEIAYIECGIARPKPGPELLRAYQKITNLKLNFDQSHSWFRVPNRLLNQKLKHNNPLAHKVYRVQAQEMLRKFYPDNEDIGIQVQQLLAGYDSRYPDAEEVAKAFGVSERTLRRKLEKANLSYRQVLDAHRQQRALTLLSNGNITLSQLAEDIGYSELASFLRAFKRWTGTSPKRYLNQLPKPDQPA